MSEKSDPREGYIMIRGRTYTWYGEKVFETAIKDVVDGLESAGPSTIAIDGNGLVPVSWKALPSRMPGRAALRHEGVRYWQEVPDSVLALEDMKGIGLQTAEKILVMKIDLGIEHPYEEEEE